MDLTVIIIILFILISLSLLVWAIFDLRKQLLKDWAILNDLERRAYRLNTKEEIEEFHKEFVEKANKLRYNENMHSELSRIDGYVRGLYKKYTV